MFPIYHRSRLSFIAALAILHTMLAPAGLPAQTTAGTPPIVFVSRALLSNGSLYLETSNTMPGVGSHSRFRVASPGRLLVRESNGAIRSLVDGGSPTAASLRLIDVNAPDVSYDGRRIVFAGFPADEYNANSDRRPLAEPDGWRIYVINADGTGLKQLSFSDQDNLDYSRFGQTASGVLRGYDDTDPVWLPDGRIVFSSTRWPALAQYSASRTTNLYVMNADGSNLHRITAERSGADRPVVDPVTGKIIFSRWWRNQRIATDQLDTVPNNQYPCCEGYERKDGLRRISFGDPLLSRNLWHLASINPDGTSLEQFAGAHHSTDAVHAYGGAFASNDEFIANFFPMANMSEAAGFGGLKRFRRGQTEYEPIIGITTRDFEEGNRVIETNPKSYGILKGNYAGEPAPLADGRILISWALNTNQDYGLYIIDRNGGNRTLLYDQPGATELRAKLLQPRPLPPIIPDSVNTFASLLPPTQQGPYDIDGTFVFDALNVYGNGPVDTIEASAPAVGSAAKIRFFADFQRINWGSLEMLDWPILLAERTVNPDGSVRENAPANIQLFEQIRSAANKVPFTMGSPRGATHVAGMNYGKPGQVARCIGCHAGHTMIPVPDDPEEAKWSNLAPGASIRASSSRNTGWNGGLIDRRVKKGKIWETWASASGNVQNQWVELVFPEPVTIRTVRLYNIRFTDGSTLQVDNATVRLGLSNSSGWLASAGAQAISPNGTDVSFANVKADIVRVEIGSVSGRTSDGLQVASLAEVEVIARAGLVGGVGSNNPPSVSLAAPAGGPFTAPASLSLVANASDSDGSISRVDFLVNGSVVGSDTTGSPYTFSWTNVSAGAYSVVARAVDNLGAVTASTPVSVTVSPGGGGGSSYVTRAAQLFYAFDDGAGSTVSDRIGSYDASVGGAATWTTLGLKGGYADSGASSFAGNALSAASGDSFTTTWVGRLDTASVYQTLFSMSDSSTANILLRYYQPNGYLYLFVNGGYSLFNAGRFAGKVVAITLRCSSGACSWRVGSGSWINAKVGTAAAASPKLQVGSDFRHWAPHVNNTSALFWVYNDSLSDSEVETNFRFAGSVVAARGASLEDYVP